VAPIAVDASAAVAVLSTPRGFDELSDRVLIAPPLLWSEVASVLHRAVVRSQVSEEFGRAAFDRLLHAPIERRMPDGLLAEAWAMADRLDWSKTSDAEYIALARLEGCTLVTADVRQRRAAERFVTVQGLDELLT
jgi:predicted nucleic acid-binding protein